LRTVLIANRGEIALRVVRACRDAGLVSISVYADSDRDAPHVRHADAAYALGGDTASETYLRIDKLIDVATRAGADAVHPGYGFLAENADFAQAVIDAGLIWIGPGPQAIRDLGDKVTARHIAERVGAPLVAGTPEPVAGADEIVAFARDHGLPVAIKAAFGGGGRGLKVARKTARIEVDMAAPSDQSFHSDITFMNSILRPGYDTTLSIMWVPARPLHDRSNGYTPPAGRSVAPLAGSRRRHDR
jgi:acetyl-CoA/propionyl-CoA carboxylase biotin carboxyl carrier protein